MAPVSCGEPVVSSIKTNPIPPKRPSRNNQQQPNTIKQQCDAEPVMTEVNSSKLNPAIAATSREASLKGLEVSFAQPPSTMAPVSSGEAVVSSIKTNLIQSKRPSLNYQQQRHPNTLKHQCNEVNSSNPHTAIAATLREASPAGQPTIISQPVYIPIFMNPSGATHPSVFIQNTSISTEPGASIPLPVMGTSPLTQPTTNVS